VKILVGCEKSHRIARAFSLKGHKAWSCDILPCEIDTPYHIQDDVRNHLDDGWDMAIFHPDCTYLANSGVRWFYENPTYYGSMMFAIDFFNKLLHSNIPRIVVENPIQHKFARQYIRKYDQIIQPWMFGDNETKATCLWLKGVPKLTPLVTQKPQNVNQSVWREAPSPDRKANRSRTFQGIADAMANQWSNWIF
jgi:hypothetical protein